jgi:toxin CcdB
MSTPTQKRGNAAAYPFCDVQNDHIYMLATRVVILLRKGSAFGPRARNLTPNLSVGLDMVVLDTAALAAIPAKLLRRPVANLRAHHAQIADAIDTLFGAC